jgi:hypothetical protein
MNGPTNNDWMRGTREPLEYRLDVGFQCPVHTPGWLDSERRKGLAIIPCFPQVSGFVLSSDIEGSDAELCGRYRGVAKEVSPFSRDTRVRQFQCLSVDLFIRLEGEHPLRVQMFGGAVLSCSDLLSKFADLRALARPLR